MSLVKLRSGPTGLGWALHPVAGVPIREDPQREAEIGTWQPEAKEQAGWRGVTGGWEEAGKETSPEPSWLWHLDLPLLVSKTERNAFLLP